MCEMLVVEFGQPLTIVDGFSHDKHGGQCETVVMHDFGQVFQLPAIDFLVGPGQVVASRHGRVLGVFLQQLLLHVIDDGGTEENAHRALASCQQVEFLFFRHGRAPLSTSEDDGLRALGNGELAPQFRRRSEARKEEMPGVMW